MKLLVLTQEQKTETGSQLGKKNLNVLNVNTELQLSLKYSPFSTPFLFILISAKSI